jgi:hypothetical protein
MIPQRLELGGDRLLARIGIRQEPNKRPSGTEPSEALAADDATLSSLAEGRD